MKKKIITILFLVFFSNHCYAQIENIKIIVNNEVITKLDVENRLKIITTFNKNIKLDKDNLKKIQDQIVNTLIEEKIVAKEAAKHKLQVTDAEINQYISNLERSNHSENGSFLVELKKNNIAISAVHEYIKAGIIFSKLVNYVVRPTIQVSEKEIEEVLGTIIPESAVIDFKQLIINPDHITNQKEYDQSIEKLNKLRSKIKKCEDVASLAANYKVDVTDLSLEINNLHTDLQNIIRILPIGKASSIITSNAGLQIIVVCKRDYTGLNLEEKEEIKETIIQRKLEKQSLHYANKLRQKAFVEIIH